MKIEIWSDVVCPFCYIGKRRLEAALAQFENSGDVQIEWKSYLLDPGMQAEPGTNINQYLAARKGWTIEEARDAHAQVTAMARESGLTYNFDRTVVANSLDAHRLIQLAKANGKGGDAEEILFRAYFTEGKNIADLGTLVDCGTSLGLDRALVENTLTGPAYFEEVKADAEEAARLGLRGVPFFVFNRKFAVSGAQPVDIFLQALDKASEEQV